MKLEKIYKLFLSHLKRGNMCNAVSISVEGCGFCLFVCLCFFFCYVI